MLVKTLKRMAALLPLALFALPVQAELTQTIKDRGHLICGTLGTSEPFSFQDGATRQLVGYDVDVCRLVADKLGVGVEYKLLAVAARIPELNSGRVDIVAANLGWTAERAEQVAFSHRYYLTPQKLLVLANSDIQSIEDLKTGRLGATKGSSSERMLKERLPEAQVIGYNDSPSTFLALQQRKIQAMFGSELAMARFIPESPADNPTRLLEEAVFEEPWGLGIRKGEDEFLAFVNQVLEEAEASGEAQALFDKWFGSYGLKRSFTIGPIAAN